VLEELGGERKTGEVEQKIRQGERNNGSSGYKLPPSQKRDVFRWGVGAANRAREQALAAFRIPHSELLTQAASPDQTVAKPASTYP